MNDNNLNDKQNTLDTPTLPTMEDNLAIPSPIYEPKPLESKKDISSNVESKLANANNYNVPQPPSIKIPDLSQNNNHPKSIEIAKEVIMDKHLEIDDEVNPITSDLNQVSASVRKQTDMPKMNKHSNEEPEKSPFEREPDDFDMIQNYVGQNGGKIINKFFNLNAIIFGPLYYAYRKMYLLGMIFFIGFLLITYFVHDLYISLGYIVLIGLLFNPLYNSKVKRDVKKIKNKYKGVDVLTLNQYCINKGGVSKSKALFALISEAVIVYAIIVFLIPEQFIAFAGEYGVYAEINNYIMKVSFDKDKLTEKLNKEGIYISKPDTEFIVNDYFEIGLLPERFEFNKEKSNANLIQYEVNDFSGINRCKFDLKAVKGYDTKEQLLNNIMKYYKSEIKKDYVNGIEWMYAVSEVSLYRYYHYVTEVNGKIVVLTFRTTKNSLKDCNEVENNILNLIIRK